MDKGGRILAESGTVAVRVYTGRAQIPLEDATVAIIRKVTEGKLELLSVQSAGESGEIVPVKFRAPAARWRRLWGNTLDSAIPALLHKTFISVQICFLDIPLQLPVRKISPEAVLFLPAYFKSFFASFPGRRIVRILPLREIAARLRCAASTVIYLTSLTRMQVAQMVSSATQGVPCRAHGRQSKKAARSRTLRR